MDDDANQADPPSPAALWLRVFAGAWALWAAWWLMMASHEAGHVIAALFTGGAIDRIDLSPLGFSQTHLSSNPYPLVVVWAGPIVGAIDAVSAWLLARWLARRDAGFREQPVFTFLAGFCLLANGVYIGLGWVDRVGDTGEMLRLGTPIAVMVAFGVVCAGAGLALWHTLGPRLRLERISHADAWRLVLSSACVVTLGFIVARLVG